MEQSRAIPEDPQEVFSRTLPVPLPTLFRRWYGPIPSITEVPVSARIWRGYARQTLESPSDYLLG